MKLHSIDVSTPLVPAMTSQLCLGTGGGTALTSKKCYNPCLLGLWVNAALLLRI